MKPSKRRANQAARNFLVSIAGLVLIIVSLVLFLTGIVNFAAHYPRLGWEYTAGGLVSFGLAAAVKAYL